MNAPRVPSNCGGRVLDHVMFTDPSLKLIKKGVAPGPDSQHIEKWLLRAAFDTPDEPYLPQDVLWRQKEQFSDGVGFSWIDGLKAHAEAVITDEDMATAPVRFRYNTPTTKEGAYFRTIFHSHFPNNNYGNGIEGTVLGGPSVACSTAKAIEWDASWSDPARQDQSGRFVATHDSAV